MDPTDQIKDEYGFANEKNINLDEDDVEGEDTMLNIFDKDKKAAQPVGFAEPTDPEARAGIQELSSKTFKEGELQNKMKEYRDEANNV